MATRTLTQHDMLQMQKRGAAMIEAANIGDLPGHEFHGNQWTTGERYQTVPLSRKIKLDSEVVWKDDAGQEHHGQIGFKNDDGTHDVKEVNVKSEKHPTLPNTVQRTLIPKSGGKLEDEPTIKVSSDKLRQLSNRFTGRAAGFRSK